MSNQVRQGVPEFTTIGNPEHERKTAVLSLLTEANDALAYLEETGNLGSFQALAKAYDRVRKAYGFDLDDLPKITGGSRRKHPR